MSNSDYSRDPDALHDDMVVARLQIVVRHDGAIGISGDINAGEQWVCNCLDEAKKAIRRHYEKMNLGKKILIPGVDAPPLSAVIRERVG